MYSYTGIIRNHIIPAIGKKKMSEVTGADIQKLYNDIAAKYRSTAEQVRVIMSVSMR